MKVKTKVKFQDAKEDKVREIGSEFEVSKERFEELQKYVEEVKETKKKK